MASSSDSDDIWHDKTLSTRQKLQRLAHIAPDRPVDLDTVLDDETFTPKTRVVPDSENLQLEFKYHSTLMYAHSAEGNVFWRNYTKIKQKPSICYTRQSTVNQLMRVTETSKQLKLEK